MEANPFTDWLLQSRIPTIRYLTLRDLLKRSDDDGDLLAAREAIMETGPVPAVLAKQEANGAWRGQDDFYNPKYKSAHWSLVLLEELHIDGHDPRFRQGVDYLLDHTADELNRKLASGQKHLECLWGNMARYAIHAGYGDDPRLKRIVDYMLLTLEDEISQCPANDDLQCAWGGGRMLWGLAALPADTRTPDIQAAMERDVTFLLDSYQLREANYPSKNRPSPLWFKLNFPVFYQTDILFMLRIVRELNLLHHPGAQHALAWLADLRGEDGRWEGVSPFRQRTWGMGSPEETNRWVSLHAAAILQDAA